MGTVSVIYDLIGRDSASKAFRSAGDSASKLEVTLSNLGKVAVAVGTAVAAGATVIATESVKSAVAFEASMEKIHTQAGATQKSVESLTKSVLNMAPSTQQGPQQLADALYHLKSVGLDNANAMKALRTASDLAAVGGANLEDTTNALAGAWRSGIKGAQTFNQAAAIVNATIGSGNMQMQDYVSAIGTGILPVARTFGLSLTSIGSALALLTDEGVPAEQAATRLKTGLALMAAPSGAAAKALASIGLSSTAMASAMRSPAGLIGALELLRSHIKSSGLDAVDAAQVISRSFGGGHTGAAVMTLLNNLDVLQRKQDQINASIGKYGGAVTAQRQTAQAQFALLRSAVDTLGIRLGLDLLPPLTKFVSFIDATALPDAERFASKVAGMLPVNTVRADADKIIEIIEGLFGIHHQPAPVEMPFKLAGLKPQQFGALIDQMGGRSQLAIPVTITGLKTQQLNAVLGQQFSALSGQVSTSLIGKLLAALKKVNWGNVLADVIQGAVSGAQQIGAAFLTLLSKINWIQFGEQFATIAIGLAIGLVNNLVPALISEAIHHPLDMASFLLALIPIGHAAGAIVDIFKDVPLLGTLTKWLLSPVEKLGGVVEDALGKVLGKVFGPVGKLIGGYFDNSKSWLVGKGEDILLGMAKGAGIGWRAVTGFLGKIPGVVLDTFARADSWLTGKGISIVDGLLGGIKTAMADIGHWVMDNIVDPIITWVKHFFGIHSPSTVMAGIGGHLMSGLFQGMMGGDLTGMVEKIFGSLPAALAKIVGKGLITIAELPVKGLQALGHGLDDLFGGGQFPGLPQLLGKTAAAAMGWTGNQWTALDSLWQRESGWNPQARNPKSGAYGIPQALPASKMASAGADWATNPLTQIKWGLGYIASTYGSPLAAWAHEQKFNWYGHGGPFRAGQVIGVGDRGPELAVFSQPGKILSPEQTAALSTSTTKLYDQLSHLITTSLSGDITESVTAAESTAVRLAEKIRRAFAEGAITGTEENTLLDRINTLIDTRGDKLVRTMTKIGLEMQAGLLSALVNATSASQVKTVMNKLIGYVEQAWSVGDITSGRARTLTAWLDQDNMRLQALATRRAKIAATIKAANSYAASTTSSTEQFAGIANITTVTQSGILGGLRNDLAKIDQFNEAIKKLVKAGLDKDLIGQVIGMGPDQGLAYADALLDGPISQIRRINATEAQINKASNKLGKNAAETMFDSGKQAGKGFLSGLKAQEKSITALMEKIAKSMVATLKKELKIKSPSAVMAEHGAMVALGLAEGMEGGASRVLDASAMLARAAHGRLLATSGYEYGHTFPAPHIPALSAEEREALHAAARRGGDGGQFTGQLYLDSGEFLGVVDGRIQKDEDKTLRALSSGSGRRR